MALAWCFPDEASDYADDVLVALEGHSILVPTLWPIEITNALLVAERRKRIKQSAIREFVELLDGLTVLMASQSVTESVSNILPLAREYNLPAYDAAYLDVAVRHGLPLATIDNNCKKRGVRLGSRFSTKGRSDLNLRIKSDADYRGCIDGNRCIR